MRKSLKITLITVGSVVAALLIAIIVMCCVVVKPLDEFRDYDSIEVHNAAGDTLPSGTVKNDYKDKLDKALDSASFSVMHATLEFVGSYGPEFVTTTDDDGNEARSAVTVAEARSACASTDSSYMLEFVYDTVREYDVNGEKISYDRMMMNVHTTDGEVQWVRIYLYRSDYNAVSDDDNSYRINPVRVRMDTSDLYIALGEIVANF